MGYLFSFNDKYNLSLINPIAGFTFPLCNPAFFHGHTQFGYEYILGHLYRLLAFSELLEI